MVSEAASGLTRKCCAALLRRVVNRTETRQMGLLDALARGRAISRHRAGEDYVGRSREYVLDPYRGEVQVTNVTYWN